MESEGYGLLFVTCMVSSKFATSVSTSFTFTTTRSTVSLSTKTAIIDTASLSALVVLAKFEIAVTMSWYTFDSVLFANYVSLVVVIVVVGIVSCKSV